MIFPWTGNVLKATFCVLMTLAAMNSTATPFPNAEDMSVRWTAELDQKAKEGILNLSMPFEARYTAEVREFTKRHFTLGQKEAEAMLGRTALYFPIFEHYLNIYGLPQELKYLPMVESTLLPTVASPAGAAGLWQMVPATARHFGLTVNGAIDERLDPYKSTEAAVKMLAYLHKEFGDWGLVLAAYNAGPGRVKKAVRAARCDSYWDVAKYLPRESKNYVPVFLAAAYLVNHFDDHNLNPKYPAHHLQDTRTLKVYQGYSFATITKVTGVSNSVLRRLNPSFVGNAIPASVRGNYLILPAGAAPLFWNHIARAQKVTAPSEEMFYQTTYTAVPGDRIASLALLFRCSIEDIVRWNHLKQAEVVVNQHLVFYVSRKAGPVKP